MANAANNEANKINNFAKIKQDNDNDIIEYQNMASYVKENIKTEKLEYKDKDNDISKQMVRIDKLNLIKNE